MFLAGGSFWHFWVAFVAFAARSLGEWQMYVRSPALAPESRALALRDRPHGTGMGTPADARAMGFGYAITIAQASADRLKWAWGGFWLVVIGTVMAATPVALGHASVPSRFTRR